MAIGIGKRIEEENQEREGLFTPCKAKYRLGDIVLSKDVLGRVLDAMTLFKQHEKIFCDWGLAKTHGLDKPLSLNLYGPPGTGKTMLAHAISHSLDKQIIVVNYAYIESKYVGETSKNITQAFAVAKETDSVLFFDEADAILSRRVTDMHSSTDVSVNQTRSVLLMLLNDHDNIVIFASNFMHNYDQAFLRRIAANIRLDLPDDECRHRLWHKLIPDELPQQLKIAEIVSAFDDISGSEIANAILMAATRAARMGGSVVPHNFFVEAIEQIRQSRMDNQNGFKIEDRIVSEGYARRQMAEAVV